ncbi:hypothetical protein [Streptomyces poonensis]|uniref:Uncharacterized protein n=1 Tax=Streptomyces poonensis TaxID=68255 RepID=A0A918PJ90_9ACTN|nr:hypothetical protein [Streptomyces poonensis]GGZ10261.1 hypothetical protein GCM10010365_31840 [Streptomyces poonensis]GLJ91347.1 hypothetical protein GCM10017589_39540 [Streptomyces poonensis]
MATLVLTATLILVVLGFGNHIYWLAAVALLFVYLQYGRTRDEASKRSSSGSGSGSGAGGAQSMPSTYRAYRDRRDRQAKWERRYRRERPLEARRQEREKSGR